MEFGHVRGRDEYNKHHPIFIPPSPSSEEEAAMAASTCSNIEHMFYKVVTPSDVGKLNRLVIPKQHAERHLPLDPSSNEKGLLLNFEDRSGKTWRFRYSYWNSSQSYVMTKGWSRFVKEKRLDPGDTVSFSRGVIVGGEPNSSNSTHLFIDWKRGPEAMQPSYPMVPFSRPRGSSRLLVQNDPNARYSSHIREVPSSSGSVFRSTPPVVVDATLGKPIVFYATLLGKPTVLDSVPVANSQQAAAKRVRLFGVNLDFQESDRTGGTQSIFSSYASSSLSPSRPKEEQLSLDLDM